jgi:hypothetical protein
MRSQAGTDDAGASSTDSAVGATAAVLEMRWRRVIAVLVGLACHVSGRVWLHNARRVPPATHRPVIVPCPASWQVLE